MDFIIYSIEDDLDISKIINKALTKQGYNVYSFYDAKSFFEAFSQKKPDLILVDLMLPDLNGIDIIKKIREDHNNENIEIIILSAKRMLIDKVEGLDIGADDYLEKPFDLLELMSRVNARLRRHKKSDIVEANDISLDLQKHQAYFKSNPLILTNKEYEILLYLLNNKGKVVSRDDLLTHIWGQSSYDYESRTVDMHIKSIRKKINDTNGSIIKTIYGVGYKIELWKRN